MIAILLISGIIGTSFAQGSQADCKKMEMVKVQGGTFAMGATAEQGSGLDNSQPVHFVTLGNYQIGKYEVTQKQWEELMGYNHSANRRADLPVTGVSWDEVHIFISRLNSLTGKQYRLPTEAEWEYAARGGNKSKNYTYSGSNSIGDVAFYAGNSSQTGTCGIHKSNELGICDMSGNAMEWCHDFYNSKYSSERQSEPEGPLQGSWRVLRGGSYLSAPEFCRVSYRTYASPTSDKADYGFRLVLSPHIISGYEAGNENAVSQQPKNETQPAANTSYAPKEKKEKKERTTYAPGEQRPIFNMFTLNASYNLANGLPKSFQLQDMAFGFRYGQYRRVGMYINLMSNFNFDGIGKHYTDSIVFPTKESYSRASVTIGLMVKLCDPVVIFAGGGLGYRSNNLKDENGKWHNMAPGSMLSYDLDMGLLFNCRGFALSLEAVTTSLKVWEAKIGIGFCLKSKK